MDQEAEAASQSEKNDAAILLCSAADDPAVVARRADYAGLPTLIEGSSMRGNATKGEPFLTTGRRFPAFTTASGRSRKLSTLVAR